MSVFFIACEKEIKLDEKEIKSRMVLNSVFADSDTIKIHLSESRSVLHNNGGDLPNITDASATLHSASGEILGTFTHENDGYYKLYDFYPQIGVPYTIKVTHPIFDEISSTSFAPQLVNVQSIDTLRKNNELELSISINDPANEENYYSISILESSTFTWFVDGQEIGMVKQIDQEGYESEDLNTKSSLMDLDLDKACFTGDAKDIKRILFALSGNTNSQYFDGGHTQVLDVSVDVSNTHQIQGVITSIDDYTAGNTQTKFSIKNCQ